VLRDILIPKPFPGGLERGVGFTGESGGLGEGDGFEGGIAKGGIGGWGAAG